MLYAFLLYFSSITFTILHGFLQFLQTLQYSKLLLDKCCFPVECIKSKACPQLFVCVFTVVNGNIAALIQKKPCCLLDQDPLL